MKIVLISGKQGSGKSSIASALIAAKNDYGFIFAGTIKFADSIYELHEYLLNKMETMTGQPRKKKDGPLLQYLGTEWGRNNFGTNVWVDITKRKVQKLGGDVWSSIPRLVIIDDCRFENEFDAFPEALKVRLVCPEEVRKVRCDAWRDNTAHQSEIGLDRYEEEKKFDMYLDTEKVPVEACVRQIMEALKDKQ